MNPVRAYLREIERQLATGMATEHTHRAALQALVESFKKGLTATNEPTRAACGAPDYIVTEGHGAVGYIEAKDIGKNLDEVERSEQLKRYLEGLPNLILTDYLEFRLYQAGEYVMDARLARPGDNGKLRVNQAGESLLANLMDAFLTASFPGVATPDDLARRMAATARILRQVIGAAFTQEGRSDTLHGQLEAFRQVLLHDLEPAQFADMYAQTICYGLFAARCNHRAERGAFTREAAAFELPETNPFLRQMFGHIAGPGLDVRLAWAVDHLAQLLDRADMGAVLKDFGRRTRQEDPVVHFYETFLAAYDAALREARGVYYTPEPVVSYIVRSVDAILRRDFGVADGLASTDKVPVHEHHIPNGGAQVQRKKVGDIHRVLILDPAAGTGTFLHGVVDLIHGAVCRKGGDGLWNGYVKDHLLPRLFGFELLMAPYAVAHMKLGLQLAESGYTFQSGERLRVYLTNTLEEAFSLGDLPLFANLIAEEANAAGQVKTRHPVMVVLGNPPYSGHSVNKGEWITRLMGEYKDGYPDLKKPGQAKWLSDDYVKFFRFAQSRIEQTGYGVLAFISNHGYLDNPTFHGMRRSLMKTFDDIFVLDLHGSVKKKEKAPDGSKDENVFDIQQGVSIGLFVKRKNGTDSKPAKIHHAEVWGPREIWETDAKGNRNLIGGKYRYLYDHDVRTTKWTRVKPRDPFQLFVPQNASVLAEYESGWSLADIFSPSGDPAPGMVTTHDEFAISWTAEESAEKIRRFLKTTSEEDARAIFRLCSQSQWDYARAKNELKDGAWKEKVTPVLYRPFDVRWTVYDPNVAVHRRVRVSRHMLAGENLGLGTTRSVEIGRGWEHVFCTRYLIQHHTVSIKEVNYLFPLYLYVDHGDAAEDLEEMAAREEARAYGIRRRANLSAGFVEEVAGRVKLAFVGDGTGDLKKTFGPEDVFDYLYAVLHSPAYRARYAPFLRMDFPRVPVTSDRKLFAALVGLGRRLRGLHLLETAAEGGASFPVAGDNTVAAVRYTEALGRVHINDAQYFEGVSPAVWNFHVGGYQVCEKWLKDRRRRALDYDEITRYLQIVAALGATLALTSQIDTVIAAHGGWPLG
ncbi:MAG: DNA methyltransferase [Candidatus Hydrogenedentes bacterium]|nr:DNA methyltransferase [Candidatus Hydrogenedentota bacterium]